MRYDYEEFGGDGNRYEFDNRSKRTKSYVDPEYLSAELDGCPSKRTMRWMLERIEEDYESDGEGWK